MPSELISVAAGRERVLAIARRLEPQSLPVSEALGRVLAAEVTAAGDLPPFESSAMDGYAVVAGPAAPARRC